MKNNLKIAIARLGTVGGGAVKILLQNADMLAERAGRNLQIVAVSARNKAKARGFDLSGVTWVDSPLDLLGLDVDVIVELIGGADGIANELVFAYIQAGKHVVTANKALIAKHGIALAELAEKHQVTIAYEAAVAGGIPIIKTIREGLAANKFSNIAGILNGTCNFILTSMQNEHKDFADALAEAQKIGYAEADPTFDIEGIDTAHKLAILTSLAYSCPLNTQNIHIEGIT
ncbi:MAG: homoserine dehydrogenase, partial [Pseudomonadota bacterium]